MGVELMAYRETKEAASPGIKSMEHFVHLLSQLQDLHHHHHHHDHEETVSEFKTLITVPNRTGHARFRRGPSNPNPNFAIANPKFNFQSEPQSELPFLSNPKNINCSNKTKSAGVDSSSISVSSSSSLMSTVTGDGSVSVGKRIFSPAIYSSGKPPLPRSHKKRCLDHGGSDHLAGKISISGRCHCSSSKKRKIIRVALTGSKTTDIPGDEHSWRKYGQKSIKGSPYPRAYYKCTTIRGCPAKKHVERSYKEPNVLIFTYQGNHLHDSTIRS